MFLSKIFFFNALLVAVICPHVSSLERRSVTNENDSPVYSTNQETPPCLPQQVFHIYNTGCNEQKPEPEKPSIEVPEGYIVTPGVGTHKLHLDKKNWNDARNTCIKEGGYLAVINSVAEEQLFEKWIAENKLGESWIGVHELFKLGDWVTVLGVPLDNVGYKHWKAGEPNNVGGVEHCGTNDQKGGMNDLDCSWEITFICEAHLD